MPLAMFHVPPCLQSLDGHEIIQTRYIVNRLRSLTELPFETHIDPSTITPTRDAIVVFFLWRRRKWTGGRGSYRRRRRGRGDREGDGSGVVLGSGSGIGLVKEEGVLDGVGEE